MDYSALLQELVYAVLIGVLPIIAKAIVTFVKKKTEELQANTTVLQGEKANQLLERFNKIVEACVIKTNNNLVDDLKQNDTFDADSQAEALKKTMTEIKELLNDEVKDIILEAYGDLDNYLETIIEKYVKQVKIESKQ